ncbi:MAG: hypothetical protein IR153_10620 [Flavobacterium sp.]|nr:hypothetical protein [Flavobacterium sp.]
MFLNYIKDFSTKKMVKNTLSNAKPAAESQPLKTIGILFDETYFHEKQALIEQLKTQGILEKDISILVFKNKIKTNEVLDYPVFSHRDFSWTATIKKPIVNEFIARNFDLLINYYDVEKAPLLLVSHLSKAKFKVGFSSIDKRLNHFMIDTTAENYKVFSDELFKYLRILNKI